MPNDLKDNSTDDSQPTSSSSTTLTGTSSEPTRSSTSTPAASNASDNMSVTVDDVMISQFLQRAWMRQMTTMVSPSVALAAILTVKRVNMAVAIWDRLEPKFIASVITDIIDMATFLTTLPPAHGQRLLNTPSMRTHLVTLTANLDISKLIRAALICYHASRVSYLTVFYEACTESIKPLLAKRMLISELGQQSLQDESAFVAVLASLIAPPFRMQPRDIDELIAWIGNANSPNQAFQLLQAFVHLLAHNPNRHEDTLKAYTSRQSVDMCYARLAFKALAELALDQGYMTADYLDTMLQSWHSSVRPTMMAQLSHNAQGAIFEMLLRKQPPALIPRDGVVIRTGQRSSWLLSIDQWFTLILARANTMQGDMRRRFVQQFQQLAIIDVDSLSLETSLNLIRLLKQLWSPEDCLAFLTPYRARLQLAFNQEFRFGPSNFLEKLTTHFIHLPKTPNDGFFRLFVNTEACINYLAQQSQPSGSRSSSSSGTSTFADPKSIWIQFCRWAIQRDTTQATGAHQQLLALLALLPADLQIALVKRLWTHHAQDINGLWNRSDIRTLLQHYHHLPCYEHMLVSLEGPHSYELMQIKTLQGLLWLHDSYPSVVPTYQWNYIVDNIKQQPHELDNIDGVVNLPDPTIIALWGRINDSPVANYKRLVGRVHDHGPDSQLAQLFKTIEVTAYPEILSDLLHFYFTLTDADKHIKPHVQEQIIRLLNRAKFDKCMLNEQLITMAADFFNNPVHTAYYTIDNMLGFYQIIHSPDDSLMIGFDHINAPDEINRIAQHFNQFISLLNGSLVSLLSELLAPFPASPTSTPQASSPTFIKSAVTFVKTLDITNQTKLVDELSPDNLKHLMGNYLLSEQRTTTSYQQLSTLYHMLLQRRIHIGGERALLDIAEPFIHTESNLYSVLLLFPACYWQRIVAFYHDKIVALKTAGQPFTQLRRCSSIAWALSTQQPSEISWFVTALELQLPQIAPTAAVVIPATLSSSYENIVSKIIAATAPSSVISPAHLCQQVLKQYQQANSVLFISTDNADNEKICQAMQQALEPYLPYRHDSAIPFFGSPQTKLPKGMVAATALALVQHFQQELVKLIQKTATTSEALNQALAKHELYHYLGQLVEHFKQVVSAAPETVRFMRTTAQPQVPIPSSSSSAPAPNLESPSSSSSSFNLFLQGITTLFSQSPDTASSSSSSTLAPRSSSPTSANALFQLTIARETTDESTDIIDQNPDDKIDNAGNNPR